VRLDSRSNHRTSVLQTENIHRRSLPECRYSMTSGKKMSTRRVVTLTSAVGARWELLRFAPTRRHVSTVLVKESSQAQGAVQAISPQLSTGPAGGDKQASWHVIHPGLPPSVMGTDRMAPKVRWPTTKDSNQRPHQSIPKLTAEVPPAVTPAPAGGIRTPSSICPGAAVPAFRVTVRLDLPSSQGTYKLRQLAGVRDHISSIIESTFG
jgi:hypothetical protein